MVNTLKINWTDQTSFALYLADDIERYVFMAMCGPRKVLMKSRWHWHPENTVGFWSEVYISRVTAYNDLSSNKTAFDTVGSLFFIDSSERWPSNRFSAWMYVNSAQDLANRPLRHGHANELITAISGAQFLTLMVLWCKTSQSCHDKGFSNWWKSVFCYKKACPCYYNAWSHSHCNNGVLDFLVYLKLWDSSGPRPPSYSLSNQTIWLCSQQDQGSAHPKGIKSTEPD